MTTPTESPERFRRLPESAAPGRAGGPADGSRARTLLIAAALGLFAFLLYAQVGDFSFTRMDDDRYVTGNPQVANGLTWPGVRWAFSSFHAANWHPVTWLSHMLDVQLFGLRPGPHHLVNAAIHAANAVLLFLVLGRATGSPLKSAAAAAIFAAHPLGVQSVAWVSERKNVLSTLFLLATVGAYTRYAARPSRSRYAAVAAWFALGLMAKPSLVAAPLLLLLLDFWPFRRNGSRGGDGGGGWTLSAALRPGGALLEKAPLIALAAISSAITVLAQSAGGAIAPLSALPLAARLTNAVVAYVRYAGMILWPSGLRLFYAHAGTTTGGAATLAAACAVTGLSLAAVRFGRARPFLLFGWAWYLVTLVPVIGLVQVGAQGMADRYAYVPLIGLAVAVVWWAGDVLSRRRGGAALGTAACGVAVAVLAVLTSAQTRHWRDTGSLVGRYLEQEQEASQVPAPGAAGAAASLAGALSRNPASFETMLAVGAMLADRGETRLAADHFARALSLDPGSAEAHRRLGVCLAALGDPAAATELETSLRLDPRSAEAESALATLLANRGDRDAAILHYRGALKLDPGDSRTHNNLGAVLADSGRAGEALASFREAVRLKPDYAMARLNLGRLLRLGNDPAEAAAELAAALEADPGSVQIRREWGLVLAQLGRREEAAAALREVLRARPGDDEVRARLDEIASGVKR